jgi:succinate-acetate transporter protein
MEVYIMSDNSSQAKWANPSPAGLVALAVATFAFFAMLSGSVDASSRLFAGVWLLGGFVVQLVVGLIDLRTNNIAGGNTFLFFCAFFMLASGIMLILKWWSAQQGITIDGRIDGYVWIALTVALILWTPAFFKSSKLLTFVVIFIDVALPFITLMDLGVMPASFSMIPAIFMLLAGITALYLSAAIVVNGTFGKNVFPMPGPFIK